MRVEQHTVHNVAHTAVRSGGARRERAGCERNNVLGAIHVDGNRVRYVGRGRRGGRGCCAGGGSGRTSGGAGSAGSARTSGGAGSTGSARTSGGAGSTGSA